MRQNIGQIEKHKTSANKSMSMVHDRMPLVLEEAQIADWINITELSEIEKAICPSLPSSKYSTLQDLEAGRHTEIEMFAATIIRIGKEFHVPTPFCEFAYEAIKATEEQNDGLFSDWTGIV